MATAPTIFFSVGEPSGDEHAAHLIRELERQCPGVRTVGYGGPRMAAAGCQLHTDLTQLAVMWFLRVLMNIGTFFELARRADRYFRQSRPDAVILVDYPGFNWWIARRAKRHGIPVFYYSPPQVWAWARWRVKKMRRFVDHVLSGLPFEVDWLRDRGINATYVGHPFFDDGDDHTLDQAFLKEQRDRAGRLITILPGSRTQEVTDNLHYLVKAATRIHTASPDVRFAIASYKPHQANLAREMVAQSDLPIEVCVGRTPELIRAAFACVSVSGSVSLELLEQKKPTVILYYISPFAYFVQSFFRRVKYITLVNLLAAGDINTGDIAPYSPTQHDADDVPFPEYLTSEDKSEQVANHVIDWLQDPAEYDRRVEQLSILGKKVGQSGAAEKASRYILSELGYHQASIPRPHFLRSSSGVEKSTQRAMR
ncbi:MAG: lipid-A-disaccharide synthase [Pirellulales bacterium]|nr:lipid-A-disaccharide synthase [Pirellulales bacterium]